MAKKKNGYEPKKRNSFQRQRKSTILISTEGKNKTETLYLSRFSSDKYNIKFAYGNDTDPIKMLKNIFNDFNDKELDPELGDLAICLVDADCHKIKNKQLITADNYAKKHKIEILVSAPCFEIWYLCHFKYSTKNYNSNEDVINELRQCLPDYEKSCDSIYTKLFTKIGTAIANAKKLEKHNLTLGNKIHTVSFSPSTEVYKIIEMLIK